MVITPFQVAQTFIGIKELDGDKDNPLILAMIQSCNPISEELKDEIPWCSAFVNFVCKHLRLPRSHSLAARSWLNIGQVVTRFELLCDADIVVFKRGIDPRKGHVGFFAGYNNEKQAVHILGGNQSNSVSLQQFNIEEIIGCRRLI
jgi:uncharacterized protein (TIGR02594 family)